MGPLAGRILGWTRAGPSLGHVGSVPVPRLCLPLLPLGLHTRTGRLRPKSLVHELQHAAKKEIDGIEPPTVTFKKELRNTLKVDCGLVDFLPSVSKLVYKLVAASLKWIVFCHDRQFLLLRQRSLGSLRAIVYCSDCIPLC